MIVPILIVGTILGIIAWTVVKSDKEGSKGFLGKGSPEDSKEDDREKIDDVVNKD